MNEGFTGIARAFPWQSRILLGLLGLTLVLFVFGIVSPIITLKKFILVENTFSVLGGVLALLKEGKFFIFIIITGFSIALPLLKMAVLFRLLAGKSGESSHLERSLHWMHLFGKWSMLDVFVVAVLVVAVKLGAIASVEMRYGLYTFAGAVILTMFITARVVWLSERLKSTAGRRHDFP